MMRRLDALLKGYVASGRVPGICAGVMLNGNVEYSSAFGWSDCDRTRRMREDTLLRVFSLTKPIVACACLLLCQRYPDLLDAPVSDLFPAFAAQRVKTARGIVPAERVNTLRTLLNMTSGIATWHSDHTPEVEALKALARDAEEGGHPLSTLEMAQRIGELPLRFQPGEGFLYGMSMDVAGAMVESVSGERLSSALEKMIFAPLAMRDTAFYAKAPERMAEILQRCDGGFEVARASRYAPVLSPPAYESGGDGLYASLTDYMRFADALASRRAPVTEALVSLMTQAEPRRLCAATLDALPFYRGGGYGLGCWVALSDAPVTGARKGAFGWYGHAGSWFLCDPGKKMSAVLLAQSLPSVHADIVPPFCRAVYELFARERGARRGSEERKLL